MNFTVNWSKNTEYQRCLMSSSFLPMMSIIKHAPILFTMHLTRESASLAISSVFETWQWTVYKQEFKVKKFLHLKDLKNNGSFDIFIFNRPCWRKIRWIQPLELVSIWLLETKMLVTIFFGILVILVLSMDPDNDYIYDEIGGLVRTIYPDLFPHYDPNESSKKPSIRPYKNFISNQDE